uniref:Actin-related protein 6 n=2 Tax=Bursaphelenchus xylophilus TaxID=6326 RepID=A0A1I7SSF6_BURXY
MRTLVLDNGAANIRANYSTEDLPIVIPNAIFKFRAEKRRVFVADEIKDYNDRSKMYYMLPHEKGYLVNWNVEFEVWDRLFGSDVLNVPFEDTRLLLTDINSLFPAFKDSLEEIVFESYQFQSLNRASAPSLIATYELTQKKNPFCMIIDSGFSFTHILPFFDGGLISSGAVRLDLGGKALTNQLKEWISYRQLDVRDETFLMNQCKEDICYVSTDFKRDMEICAKRTYNGNTVARDYLLPDFLNHHRGVVMEPSSKEPQDRQKLAVNTERFTIPELLFSSSDIGLNQSGIPESFAQSLAEVGAAFPNVAFNLPSNIICVGGNTKFPGFIERLHKELLSWCPQGSKILLNSPSDPLDYAWRCGRELTVVKEMMIEDGYISRNEYLEHGDSLFYKKASRNIFSF